MPPAGFEPAIPESERPQTHSLNLAASGIAKAVIHSISHLFWLFNGAIYGELFGLAVGHVTNFVTNCVYGFPCGEPLKAVVLTGVLNLMANL
jgi:hypothetical protein